MKFQLPQYLPKTYAASKQDRVIDASFRRHGQCYTEKYSNVFLWNPRNALTGMYRRRKKKNDTLSVSLSRDSQISTCAKCLNIKYKFYDSVVIL